jgi:hypothetical protein
MFHHEIQGPPVPVPPDPVNLIQPDDLHITHNISRLFLSLCEISKTGAKSLLETACKENPFFTFAPQ